MSAETRFGLRQTDSEGAGSINPVRATETTYKTQDCSDQRRNTAASKYDLKRHLSQLYSKQLSSQMSLWINKSC